MRTIFLKYVIVWETFFLLLMIQLLVLRLKKCPFPNPAEHSTTNVYRVIPIAQCQEQFDIRELKEVDFSSSWPP